MSRSQKVKRPPIRIASLRAAQIVIVTAWYGAVAAATFSVACVSGRRRTAAAAIGRVVSAWLRRLGPAFIKAGQLLCTREDVLSVEFCLALRSALLFGSQSRPDDDDAGGVVDVGSVARVRRVRMADLDVAIKTVRLGTTQRLQADLAILQLAMSALTIFARRSAEPIAQVVREVCESVRLQTDLQREAATLDRLAALESVVPVLVPKVLHSHCTADRLVMTWLPGQADGRDFADPRQTAKHLLLAVYEMLFNTGIVHCDLHPGNWWELPDGRLAVVDAGFACELDDEMRVHFASFFIGMATRNADACTAHALAACAKPIHPHCVAGFRSDMQALIDSTRGKTAGSFSLAGFAARFFAIQRRHHAYSKAAFIFPFMALLAIEGQLKQLDPHIDFQSLAGPIALRAVAAHAATRESSNEREGGLANTQ